MLREGWLTSCRNEAEVSRDREEDRMEAEALSAKIT